MSGQFIHIGVFTVKLNSREEFVQVMKDYESAISQHGLDHSHLVELENKPSNFRYITIWKSKADWETVENLDEHKEMHIKRDALLTEEAKSNIGTVVI
jgi:heme-degrading monooxygenase HmoA